MSSLGSSCSHLPNKFIYPVDESNPKKPAAKPAPAPEDNASARKEKEEKTGAAEAKPEAKPEVKQDSEPKKTGLPDGTLSHEFDSDLQKTWDKTFETMLAFPLVSSDRTGGVILTDWIVDPKYSKNDDLPMIGAGPTLVRYRYAVKLHEKDGGTELLLVQLAQRSSTHIWVNRPPLKEATEKLMDKIILNMGN